MNFATLTLASARLSRLITTDDLGQWLVKEPIDRLMDDYEQTHTEEPWWWKYRSGLDCPHCFSFWAALAVFGVEMIAGDSKAWRLLTSALATSYVVGHVSARLDDRDEDDDEDDA